MLGCRFREFSPQVVATCPLPFTSRPETWDKVSKARGIGAEVECPYKRTTAARHLGTVVTGSAGRTAETEMKMVELGTIPLERSKGERAEREGAIDLTQQPRG